MVLPKLKSFTVLHLWHCRSSNGSKSKWKLLKFSNSIIQLDENIRHGKKLIEDLTIDIFFDYCKTIYLKLTLNLLEWKFWKTYFTIITNKKLTNYILLTLKLFNRHFLLWKFSTLRNTRKYEIAYNVLLLKLGSLIHL